MQNEWLVNKIKSQKEAAIEEKGRQEGRIQAFRDVEDYFNPDKYCQVCGDDFWSKESRDRHYKENPTHAPGYVPPAEPPAPQAQ